VDFDPQRRELIEAILEPLPESAIAVRETLEMAMASSVIHGLPPER